MPVDSRRDSDSAALRRSIMPPYLVLRDFLEGDMVGRLLDFALTQEQAFHPTKVGRVVQCDPNPAIRVSKGTRQLGDFKRVLKSRVQDIVPDLLAKLRTPSVAAPKIELELVAHNDGAFYTRHIDTQTASDYEYIRVLSAVYYFHTEPRQFGGGALRLYAVGNNGNDYVDIDPAHNSLLVFPSWAPHEVRPVHCPSKRFIDSRFAINCWVHRKRTIGQ